MEVFGKKDEAFAVFSTHRSAKKRAAVGDGNRETTSKRSKNLDHELASSREEGIDGAASLSALEYGAADLFEISATGSKVHSEEKTSVNRQFSVVGNQEDETEGPKNEKKAENILNHPNLEYNLHTTCVHEISYPPADDVFASERKPINKEEAEEERRKKREKWGGKPAKTYKFSLDAFQRESVAAIEAGESVLVSAHTSAGKTVVAEYAIATALREHQRVIYTSPIKALSNQKYRELYEEFEDVGLMTGDVTINENASCLVMTTEILRSMLYRGSEVLREVSWIIFDEIHYMRDRERGVVWEESIILVPDKIRFVFLSATIPNAKEFADWIAKVHQQVCHVVYTDYRPTPLQHYMFPSGGDGLHLVVDEKGNFREENFQKALAAIVEPAGKPGSKFRGGKGGKGGKGGGPGGSDVYKIVKMIMERNYDPVIVFSFSKRECEGYALQMTKLDFNDEEEKKLVEAVFHNAIDSLSDDDKRIPQVEHILPLLKRGIGIHHSGLLPILKEVIEILFQEGLIKALFATETFSIGLNMPAKTVVFTSVRKFDGQNFRWISSGEYIQMSGRAGRRGKDDRGIVILMVDEKMEPAVAKNMVMGQADSLNSTFHLGYNMLLNLLRVEDADPDYVIKRSFSQFQNLRNLPALEKKLKALEDTRVAIVIEDESAVEELYEVKKQLSDLESDMRAWTNKPKHALPFLQPGRMAKVLDGDDDWGWGVIVNFQKKAGVQGEGDSHSYVVDVLLRCAPAASGPPGSQRPKPARLDQPCEIHVVPVLLAVLNGISSVRVIIPKDLRPQNARDEVGKTVAEVLRRFKGSPQMLHPLQDMNIADPAFLKLHTKVETLRKKLQTEPQYQGSSMAERLKRFAEKAALAEEAKVLKKEMRSSTEMQHKDELKRRKRCLRRLGFTNKDDVVEVKGRVACEITTGDELLATELIFNNIFQELGVEQAVALLSCLIYQEKSKENVRLKEELAGPLRVMQDAARRIGTVSKECKINTDIDEYVDSFKPDLMDVVFAWCKGAKFAEICKLTDIFEGSIIRAMRRLEELLRQMGEAAKAIGNEELEKKFLTGIEKLKRDIVFAASLYL